MKKMSKEVFFPGTDVTLAVYLPCHHSVSSGGSSRKERRKQVTLRASFC